MGLGLVVGVAWWLLAPTGAVVLLQGGSLASATDPELTAAQDGWLVLLGALAGLVSGAVAVAHPGESPIGRSLQVVAGCALGAVAAQLLGGLLGPATVASQLAAGATPAEGLVSPLRAHSAGVPLVWPALAALVMASGHLVAAWSGSRTRPPAALSDG